MLLSMIQSPKAIKIFIVLGEHGDQMSLSPRRAKPMTMTPTCFFVSGEVYTGAREPGSQGMAVATSVAMAERTTFSAWNCPAQTRKITNSSSETSDVMCKRFTDALAGTSVLKNTCQGSSDEEGGLAFTFELPNKTTKAWVSRPALYWIPLGHIGTALR